jgi:hypothetical protein
VQAYDPTVGWAIARPQLLGVIAKNVGMEAGDGDAQKHATLSLRISSIQFWRRTRIQSVARTPEGVQNDLLSLRVWERSDFCPTAY